MRSIPLENLPYAQRETYTLLRRVQSLPFELQERVISFLATDYDHLRVLKRLSHATWDAVRPVLHRTLRLTNCLFLSRFENRWTSARHFMDLLPSLAKHCQYLLIDLDEPPCWNFIHWRAELPRTVATMSRLQTMCIAGQGVCEPHLLIAAAKELPQYGSARVVASLPEDHVMRFWSQAFFRTREQQATSDRLPRSLALEKTREADIEKCAAAFDVSRLRLCSVQGQRIGSGAAAFSHLTHLAIQDGLSFSSIFNILRACSVSLHHLGIRLTDPWDVLFWLRVDDNPLSMPQLRSLSLEVIFPGDLCPGPAREPLRRRIDAPRLEHLGVGDICNCANSSHVGPIDNLRHGTTRPMIYTRDISEAGRIALLEAKPGALHKALIASAYDDIFLRNKGFIEAKGGVL